MLRITHIVSTSAILVATAGLVAPAAQAQADGLYPHVSSKNVVGFVDRAPKLDNRLGARIHDTPLANPVAPNIAVTGRTVSTSGGIDWTFPVMGAIAVALVMMVLGEQVLVRRGRLAT
jgi:hypothetical protein